MPETKLHQLLRDAAAPGPAPAIATRYRLSLVEEATLPYGDDRCVNRPAEAARFLWMHLFHDEPREVVAVVFVNAKNRATGHMVVFAGTTDRAVADPRLILAAALLANASGILLAHNHPSGDPTPSAEDQMFTRRMEQACEIVGLRLLDHLIVCARERWTSLCRKATW